MRPLTGKASPSGLLSTRTIRVFGIALRSSFALTPASMSRGLFLSRCTFDLLFRHDARNVLVGARFRRRRDILGAGRHINYIFCFAWSLAAGTIHFLSHHVLALQQQRYGTLRTSPQCSARPARGGRCAYPHPTCWLAIGGVLIPLNWNSSRVGSTNCWVRLRLELGRAWSA